jgi:transposase
LIKRIGAWKKQHGMDITQCLVCLEPTGQFTNLLLQALVEAGIPTWLAHANDIQQSLGLQRGKSDPVDALRIAQYAFRFRDKVRLFTADHLRMDKLKQLLMKRRQLVEARMKLQVQVSTVNPHMHQDHRSTFNAMDRVQLRCLTRLIKKTEAMILAEIELNHDIKDQYDLLVSVPGIGLVLAANLIALTDAFTRFTSARELVCHAGAAPFEHTSGSSVRGRTRTSRKANVHLKHLTHMAALVSIKRDPQIRTYYERKRAEGKPALCVINAIRAKVIHRAYAVLKRQSPFVMAPVAPPAVA